MKTDVSPPSRACGRCNGIHVSRADEDKSSVAKESHYSEQLDGSYRGNILIYGYLNVDKWMRPADWVADMSPLILLLSSSFSWRKISPSFVDRYKYTGRNISESVGYITVRGEGNMQRGRKTLYRFPSLHVPLLRGQPSYECVEMQLNCPIHLHDAVLNWAKGQLYLPEILISIFRFTLFFYELQFLVRLNF
jgi:hypothetical protein